MLLWLSVGEGGCLCETVCPLMCVSVCKVCMCSACVCVEGSLVAFICLVHVPCQVRRAVCVCVCVCVCLSSVSESQQLQELFMMKPSLEDVLCSVMHTENDCESLLPEKT